MLAFLVTFLSLQAFVAHGQIENVFSYLQHNGNFTTLVKLLKEAGLAGTLATSGIFFTHIFFIKKTTCTSISNQVRFLLKESISLNVLYETVKIRSKYTRIDNANDHSLY